MAPITDSVPSQQTLTLGPGRYHQIPHALRGTVLVQVRTWDGDIPMWVVGDGVGLGPIVTVLPDEVLISLPEDGEGLTVTIVGMPRATHSPDSETE